jgi:non-heme chloroperoxidase
MNHRVNPCCLGTSAPGRELTLTSESVCNPEAPAVFRRSGHCNFQKRTISLSGQFQRDLPQRRVVRIARADHYVFLSNESEVLKELNAFITSLP